MKKLNYLVSYN